MSTPIPGLPSVEELFEHAPCGLMFADASGVLVRMNATAGLWLGYYAEDVVGKVRIQDLLTVGGRVFYETHCVPLLQAQGSVSEVQMDMRRRNGERLPMLLNIARRRHQGAMFEEFALFVATDRKSYERELLAARRTAEASLDAQLGAEARLRESHDRLSADDRRKDEFLATLAHELRNPLAPMSAALEVLRLTLPADGPRDKILGMFGRQLGHMTHLVDDLMEVSRITQGRMELRREPLPLASVIASAAADVQPMIAAASHALEVILPGDDVIVDGDPTRLVQVIANLLGNAAKYTPAGGRITLRAGRVDDEAVISVADNGIGIPREFLSTVFDMFSQLEPALKRSRGGLGIGLALVKGIVRLHGGTIEARSDGSGMGSEFIVRLPIAARKLQAASDLPRSSASPLKILVVDDNVDAAEMLAEALGLSGHATRTVHDATAALEAGAGFLPDVALFDIGLPDMTGYELAQRARAQAWGANLLLIAATGWGQEADKRLALDAGFDEHLTKPIDFDKLGTILARRASRPR